MPSEANPREKCLPKHEGFQGAISEEQTDPPRSEGSLAQRESLSKFHTLPFLPIHVSYRSDKAMRLSCSTVEAISKLGFPANRRSASCLIPWGVSCWSVITFMYWFPRVSVTKHRKLGSLKQQKCIPSQSWRPDVWSQCFIKAMLPPKVPGKNPSSPLLASSGCCQAIFGILRFVDA